MKINVFQKIFSPNDSTICQPFTLVLNSHIYAFSLYNMEMTLMFPLKNSKNCLNLIIECYGSWWPGNPTYAYFTIAQYLVFLESLIYVI